MKKGFCSREFPSVLLGFLCLVGAMLLMPARGLAATHYVDLNNLTPASPFATWDTAATNIQDAVDTALAGDDVLVTNGVYQTGATAVYGMSNRVAVTKAVMVQSVNGPGVTAIVGSQNPGTVNSLGAIRCIYLTNGAFLAGFTLTNGATQKLGDVNRNQSGGGVWCESVSAVISNCVLAGNSCYFYGGGAYKGTLNNCTLMGNSSVFGGGAYRSTLNNCTLTANSGGAGGGASACTLNNCTLTGNVAHDGGGAYAGTLNNCTIMGNWAGQNGGGVYVATLNNCTVTGNSAAVAGGVYSSFINNCIVFYNTVRLSAENYTDSVINYSCTTPLPAGGAGNLADEPQLASASHLSAGSPCRGAGSAAYTSGLDIDGQPWANPPSIGCDEYRSGSVTGAVSATILASYSDVVAGFELDFAATINGRVSASRWDFGDGVIVSNRPYASHAWAAPGDYTVELRAYNETHPEGVAAGVTVHVFTHAVHYVSVSSPGPLPPFNSWATRGDQHSGRRGCHCSGRRHPGYQWRLSGRSAGSVWDEQPRGCDPGRAGPER